MSDARARPAPTTASGPGGSIYDLGYQRYDGPRLGRPAAVRALFWHTLRSCYGIGRGGRAKIAPFTLAAMALLPAIFAIGVAALISQAGPGGGRIEAASPIRYSTYYGIVSTFAMLFCAAQGPELLGRDQRYGVLPLYFSRAMLRVDYALAKTLGLMAALLGLLVVPQLVLFVGRALAAPDLLNGLATEASSLPAVVGQGALVACLYGALTTLVSAWTPRRAYATASIIALFVIPPIVVGVLAQLHRARAVTDWLVATSAADLSSATNALLFGIRPDSAAVRASDLPLEAYLGIAIVGIAGSMLLTVRRYMRISA